MDVRHPESEYLVGSMKALTEVFRGTGSRFFLEGCSAGRHDFPGGKRRDVRGWIAPLDAVPVFEARWRSGEGPDELADLSSWGVRYVDVVWKAGEDGMPVPFFGV